MLNSVLSFLGGVLVVIGWMWMITFLLLILSACTSSAVSLSPACLMRCDVSSSVQKGGV